MGLFGKRPSRDEAMGMAQDIADGRGLQGKLMRGLMGRENADRLGQSLAAAQSAQSGAQAAAAGLPTMTATVTQVIDTGRLINFDPVLVLAATLADGTPVQVETLVSKTQIPRVGDAIALIDNPAQPGTLAYAGPAWG